MIISLRKSSTADHARLFSVWQTAVAATHHFLNEKDALEIADLVRDQYIPNVELLVAVDADDHPLAFVGMSENIIDALFVHADHFGKGIGSDIIKHMQAKHDSLTLDVNEGNPGARAFYEKHGFIMIGRSETDDEGRPYPIIHMRWSRK